jgi:hypothetical protein
MDFPARDFATPLLIRLREVIDPASEAWLVAA